MNNVGIIAAINYRRVAVIDNFIIARARINDNINSCIGNLVGTCAAINCHVRGVVFNVISVVSAREFLAANIFFQEETVADIANDADIARQIFSRQIN